MKPTLDNALEWIKALAVLAPIELPDDAGEGIADRLPEAPKRKGELGSTSGIAAPT